MSDERLRELALIRQCVKLEDAKKLFDRAIEEAKRAGRAEAFERAAGRMRELESYHQRERKRWEWSVNVDDQSEQRWKHENWCATQFASHAEHFESLAKERESAEDSHLAALHAKRAGRAEIADEIRARVLELGEHYYKNVEHTGAAMRLLARDLEAIAAKERESAEDVRKRLDSGAAKRGAP